MLVLKLERLYEEVEMLDDKYMRLLGEIEHKDDLIDLYELLLSLDIELSYE